MSGLVVTPTCTIPAADLVFSYARSSGPGGQNVNKVETKVELRYQLATSVAVSEARKRRLAVAFPSHVTQDGEFVVHGDRYRSQRRNREDVLQRLREMLLSVWHPPRARIATRVSATKKRQRVSEKRQRGEVKRQRRSRDFD